MPLLPRLDQPLRVPPPFCPFPPAVHPRVLEMDARTNAWMTESGLFIDNAHQQKLLRVGAAELTARGIPFGEDERTQDVSDVGMWLFAVDDYCDETGFSHDPGGYAMVASRIQRAVEAPEVDVFDDNPYAAAVRHLRRRLEANGASPMQLTRWAYAVRTFLFGQINEAHHRATGTIPNLSDFMVMRLDTVGTLPVFLLSDYAAGFELPPAEMDNRAVRALTEMASMLFGLDNEIVSFHKESRRSPDDINLIAVLAHQHRISLPEAQLQTVDLRNRVMARFARLGDEVIRHGSPELATYVGSLRTWVRGHCDWTYDSDRYINPDDAEDSQDLADLTSGCTDVWPAGCSEPAAIASIAWWWDPAHCEAQLTALG